MTWFLIALVVAIGGIYTFYIRSKGTTPIPKPKAPEGPRINMNDPAEVERYKKEFGVDEWDLKGAVQDAGPGVEAVRRHLRDK